MCAQYSDTSFLSFRLKDDYYQALFELDQHILSKLDEVAVSHIQSPNNYPERAVRERESFGAVFNNGYIRQTIELILTEFREDETKTKLLKR